MKQLFAVLMMALVAQGCQEVEPPTAFTGYETTYELVSASSHGVTGLVVFKERLDGSTTVLVALNGTAGEALHPVHMHMGNLATPDADVAALLEPVAAKTGRSETILTSLADETRITYKDLASLKACIKIHLSDVGAERDIVLAGGDIGQSYADGLSSGRRGIAVCKSE